MDGGPRYSSLRDYLRVLKEQRVVVVLVTLVFAGAALVVSLRDEPIYLSEATLSLRDETQGFELIGDSIPQRDTPEQRAAVTARQVTGERIVQRVSAQLNRRIPIDENADEADREDIEVAALAEVRTNFVVIQARSRSAEFSARLANSFATQTRAVLRADARERFTRAADELQRASRRLRRTPSNDLQRSIYRDRIASARFLAGNTNPVDVVESATAADDPISPLPVRNSILGALLGLAVGLLAAFVRDSLDRRLKGAREIQEQLSWPVVGHIREDALGRAGPVVANGRRPPGDSDLESFRILRTNLSFLDVDTPPRVILVTSALPAEGKSTVAASLACASAAAGTRTVLVECDLRRPSLSGRFGLEGRPGLIDYLIGEAAPADVMRMVPAEAILSGAGDAAATEAKPLVVIPAGRPTTHPAELLGSERFREFLRQIGEAYEQVIVDSSPLLSVVDTLEILPNVEGVLLCVRARETTREQMRAAREAIQRVPERPTGIVITGLRPGDDSDFGYYSYSYAYGTQDA